jgi:hypothetical protein
VISDFPKGLAQAGFIQFDNVVIELVQYRDADQSMGSSKSFAEAVLHMSHALPRMMHICFYVDIARNADVQKAVVRAWSTGKLVTAICHGPYALLGVALGGDAPFVRGKKLTSFSKGRVRLCLR